MSDFPGPFDPPELTVPLPPPIVGTGSPWAPADGENRDRILDWWRMWFRRVFFPWLASFIAYLNTWLTDAETYIIAHSIAGYSIRLTADPLALTGTTNVTITLGEDDTHRPLTVGDVVLDQTTDSRFGIVTTVIDATHATVQTQGTVKGTTGNGWWVTATTIAHTGTTDVILVAQTDRTVQLNDLVVDSSTTSAYGAVTTITDPTHVTVTYIGTLQGPPGIADAGFFNYTTPALAPGAVNQSQMIAEPNMVGAFSVNTTHPAWVRVYASNAYMIADATRTITTPLDIAADHGCYLDFVSTALELTKTLTPGIQLTDLGLGLWLSITNTDPTDPQTIAVHFDYRIFRQ
jgi:hypothetical protein